MGDSLYAQIARGYNPLTMATQALDLQSKQFQLQQAQLQPAYSGLMALRLKGDAVNDDDVNAALADSQRLGGDTSGLQANYAAARARGVSPADYVRAESIRGVPPFEQLSATQPVRGAIQTDAGTFLGSFGAPGGAHPELFTPSSTYGFVPKGLTPTEQRTGVGIVGPGGTVQTVPAGSLYDGGAGGGDGTGGGAGGGATSSGLNKQQFLAETAQRESNNNPTALNSVAREDPTAYARGATASGKYQIVNSTWQQGAGWAGVDITKYPTAASAPESVQDQVASALYDHLGETPWQKGNQNWVRGPGGQYTLQPVAPGTGGGVWTPPPQGQQGPFIGATTAEAAPAPVPGGGGFVLQPPTGFRLPPGYTLPQPGSTETWAPSAQRAAALQGQLQASINMRPLLTGMEDELDTVVKSGVGARANSTLRQLLVNMGLINQQGQIAETQSAQEQFNKFAQIISGATLQQLGNASNDRQTLAQESNPGLELSYLGNKGIIHMLEGQQQALQVFGRAWQDAMASGVGPANFDLWRNQFTAPDQTGGRFDPRVFWMANMTKDEQKLYIDKIKNPVEKEAILKNMDYAERHGWITGREGGGIVSPY